MNVHFISLGCPRNLVDTEIMLGQLLEKGHTITANASEANCVVVNTCGFTRPATDESIDTILEMAHWKSKDRGRRLIVVGCLPERYRLDLAESLPEVDVFLGTGAYHQIVDVVENLSLEKRILLPPPVSKTICGENLPKVQTTPPYLAYLRIAEGCSAHCTYCIIPKLRGPHRSRPMEEVVSEARVLADGGTKEIVLVAQNSTAYGSDLGLGYGVEHLLEKLANIEPLTWIRMLYGHPDYITDGLIETIGNHEKLVPYFDIPIQHISEPILKKMGRNPDSKSIYKLIEELRNKTPGAVLRTTLMVGFPGETEQDFDSLLRFIEHARFDHMGAFMYSGEKDLPSNRLEDHIPEDVKQERFDCLMSKQANISRENYQKYVGRTLKVLVEGTVTSEDPKMVGRAAFQAPEIDGVVYIHQGTVRPGSFVDVCIRQAYKYDLIGDMT